MELPFQNKRPQEGIPAVNPFEKIRVHEHNGADAPRISFSRLRFDYQLPTAYGGTGASAVSAARANLGLAIGTDVQAWDTLLDSISALSDPNADRILFWDDSATAMAWLQLGNGLTITTTTIAADTASTTVDGVVELATAAETTTGTDATRAVTPDGLAGSDYGIRLVQAQIVEGATNTAVGDGAGNFRFFIPAQLNGYNLVVAHAAVVTAGTTNTTDIQIHNVTQAADMLSTKITIDSSEKTSYTAATAPVIDTANDDVATGDEIRIDVDAVSTTPAKGLSIILGFQLP